ncbi:MAG TPA: hypothetical protein VMB23_07265, partial [Spirochaetia bacterium]|nr:hypothetical protein [Spirochaetia bacterium]
MSFQATAWALATPHGVRDAQGRPLGWFKALWTPQALVVEARVAGSAAAGDVLTVYLDPTNAKSKAVPPDAIKVSVPRDQGVSDPDGFTAVVSVPFPSAAKTM